MTTSSARELLSGYGHAKARQEEAVRNTPPWERERQPLDEWEGVFTGDVEQVTETTPNGKEIPLLKFRHTEVKVIKSADANYTNTGDYYITVPEPLEGRLATSELGMIEAAAVEAELVKDSWAELIGKRVHYVRDAKLPWKTASNPKYFYRPVSVEGIEAKAPADPQVESAALAYAVGITANDFRQGAIKHLNEQGLRDDSLFAEIAGGKFLTRMEAEGKLKPTEAGTFELASV